METTEFCVKPKPVPMASTNEAKMRRFRRILRTTLRQAAAST
jgi:hypothetical protein